MPQPNSTEPVKPLHVIITREPFSDFYQLTTPVDGYTEELEVEEVREWFRQRGANADAVQEALDQAWNFARAEISIGKPRLPSTPRVSYAPDI
jgi:hypothetical protein